MAAPSFSTIEKLADALGVPEVVFFGFGLTVGSDNERSRLLTKIQASLSRMNNAQLARAMKVLDALTPG